MHTPTKEFRLKPQFKSMITLMKSSKEEKNAWKKMFIEAQLCEEVAKRTALKSKDRDGENIGRARGAVAPE